MSVGGGPFGRALAAETMHGGDDVHRAEGEVFMKLAQLGAAADVVGIEPAETARHAVGAVRRRRIIGTGYLMGRRIRGRNTFG